jgi:hypothetical protein
MINFTSLMNAVGGDDFEERPVDIRTFVTSPKYLNMAKTPLSEYQYQLVEASSQIYFLPTLISLYGEEDGKRRWKNTVREVIAQLGKGSGKDFLSTIACAYIVYLLLCLRDPAEYYDKPAGDSIDILNIAINAQQANNVFFKNFAIRIERSPWFEGKYEKKAGHMAFIKNINVYSGHSEREAWEGYNVLYVVLDEISGFALDVNSASEHGKTAEAVYKMYRASVTSRFPDVGKLVLLSFPRFKDDYIQQRYKAAVEGDPHGDPPTYGEKTVIEREHTFQIDPDLPPGTKGNEFTIRWEEDHILRYAEPRVFALKRPSWEVNPTKKISNYMEDFLSDPVDALSRFACMPPDAIDAFFKDREKMETAFRGQNGVDDQNRFNEWFKPKEGVKYYIHVDLAQKQDRCVVTMAHVEKWQTRNIGGQMTEPAPLVKVDVVRWWTPTSDKTVDFTDVREFILALARRGFDIKLVTFDRWNSHDIMNELRRHGLRSEILSVAKKHYTDMAMMVHEERLSAPHNDLFIDELLALRITKADKIDHSRSGKKDFSDSICGAIFNAISHTPRSSMAAVEVKTLATLEKEVKAERAQEEKFDPEAGISPIRAPKREHVPDQLATFLEGLRIVGG